MKSIRPHRLLTLAAVLLGLFASTLSAATSAPAAKPPVGSDSLPFDIAVRSEVDKPFGGFKHTEPPDHGKLFAVIALEEIKGEAKLVRPVNESELLQLVGEELAKRGYRQVVKGETPQILLIVHYGRGYLRNPYTADASPNDTAASMVGEMSGGLSTVTITGAMATQLFKERQAGFETKLQRARLEKLYIRVTAWQYPPPKGHKKPEMARKTTMLMDDPDNTDLNLVAKQLLAAGGAYFDHATKDEEAEARSDVPEGQVKIGTPEVVKASKEKTP